MKVAKYIRPKLFLFFGIVVALIEILAYKNPGQSTLVASYVWATMGIIYFTASLYYIISTLKKDFKDKYYLGVLLLPVFIIFTFWRITDYSNLSFESTQQVAAGLNNFTQKGFGYTQIAFLGYPSRQYLISALPSLLFGRSLINLRLGSSIPFLTGVLLFYSGLRSYFSNNKNGKQLATLGALSIFMFPYVPEFLHHYEQINFPLSLTLNAVSWYLFFLNKPSYFNAINLTWIGALLVTSYTPSLGTGLLLLTFMSILLINNLKKGNRKMATILFTMLLLITVFGAMSFTNRQDIPKVGEQMRVSEVKNISAIISGYKIFFLSNPKTFVSSIIAIPVFIYLFTSIIYLNGLSHFLISTWSLGTVAAAVYLMGYSVWPVSFEMHRALIIVPPLITGMLIVSLDVLNKYKVIISRLVVFACFLFLSVYSLWSIKRIKSQDPIRPEGLLTKDIIHQASLYKIKHDNNFSIYLYSNISSMQVMQNSLVYFYPNINFSTNRELVGTLTDNTNLAFVYIDSSYTQLSRPSSLHKPPVFDKPTENFDYEQNILDVLSSNIPPENSSNISAKTIMFNNLKFLRLIYDPK